MSDPHAIPAGQDTPQASDPHAQLDRLIERLELAAEQLRTGDLDPDVAASVVEQCAATASEASAELERLARAAAHEPLPGQDQLL